MEAKRSNCYPMSNNTKEAEQSSGAQRIKQITCLSYVKKILQRGNTLSVNFEGKNRNIWKGKNVKGNCMMLDSVFSMMCMCVC